MAHSPARTRAKRSQLDARVTLFSLDTSPEKPSTSSSSNQTKQPTAPTRTPPLLQTGRKRTRRANVAAPDPSPVVLDEPGPANTGDQKPAVTSTKSPRKPKAIKLSLETPHPAPPRWEEAYQAIHQQRQSIVAPVDTMGCDKAGDRDTKDPTRKIPERSEQERRLSCLVSLMLSSQTKDEVTAQATLNLRLNLANGLTVQSLREARIEEIQACINKVGFWRRKSEYIKEMAEVLYRQHNSDVPKTLDELVALKGVGPKMAFLALASAWSLNQGIGVDTHVHRITNRLGWHRPETTDPEKTRLNLESWLPKHLHQEINHMLVGFGQLICLPIGPRCDECAVGSIPGLCPFKKLKGSSTTSPKKKNKKLIKVEEPRNVVIKLEEKPIKEVEGGSNDHEKLLSPCASSSLSSLNESSGDDEHFSVGGSFFSKERDIKIKLENTLDW